MTKVVILVAASNGMTNAKDAADWGGQSRGAAIAAATVSLSQGWCEMSLLVGVAVPLHGA